MTTALDPTTEAETWLYSTLTGSSAVTAACPGGVWANVAPRTVDTTQVTLIYQHVTSHADLYGVGLSLIWSPLIFRVHAVVEGNDQTAIAAAYAVAHAAIQGGFGFTTNAEIICCFRERVWSFVEITDSIEYLHRGGDYQINIRPRS